MYPEAKEYLSRTKEVYSSHKAAVRWDMHKRQFQSSRVKGHEKGERKSFGLARRGWKIALGEALVWACRPTVASE
jgi:hypothetical protein